MRTTLAALLLVCTATQSHALGFKNYGTVGTGGAGVARPPAGLEGYWNPAALAFNDGKKCGNLTVLADGASRGDLPQNLKKLSDSTDSLTQAGLPAGPTLGEQIAWQDAGFADNIGIASAFLDIGKTPDSTVRAGGGVALGQSVGRFGFGLYGTGRSAVSVVPDTDNLLPDMDETNPMTFDALRAGFGGLPRPESAAFFGATLAGELDQKLIGLGMSPAEAASLRSGMDARLATTNPLHLSPGDAADTLFTLAEKMKNGNGGAILQNNSLIRTFGLVLLEAPLSYGHLFDLGSYGQLGAGVTAKVMFARVYATDFRAYMTDIGTAYERLETSYSDSFNAGVDAGLLWRSGNLRIGAVGKHLNSPRFARPDGGRFIVRPSVRAGGEYQAFEWLRLAADMDITKSDEILQSHPTRMAGGGAELSLGGGRLRLGATRDLESRTPALITAGVGYAGTAFSIGLDGACGTGRTRYDGKSYPNAAQLQLSVGYSF